jgi:hypothetical protein
MHTDKRACRPAGRELSAKRGACGWESLTTQWSKVAAPAECGKRRPDQIRKGGRG